MSAHSSGTSSCVPTPPGTPPVVPSSIYVAGTRFVAQQHDPPPPFGRYHSRSRTSVIEVPNNASQLEWCLQHPPLPGTTHPDKRRYIEVAQTIRTGSDCGAQVMLTTEGLIAKFYDPLYYHFYDSDPRYGKLNVTRSADKDYAAEAAAYSEFDNTPLQGDAIPKYYGSWTVNIDTLLHGIHYVREVRCILIEHIPGPRMLDLEPKTLSPEERENIMHKLIDAQMEIHFAGLVHEDLEPRNIILSLPNSASAGPGSFAHAELRVCIIDLAISSLARIVNGQLAAPEYRNPLHYWATQQRWSDYEWLPPQEEAVEWMWKTWGDGGKEGKYVKAERDPDREDGNPKRPVCRSMGES